MDKNIWETEKETQNKVINFFKDTKWLDYEYIGNLSKNKNNKNIIEDKLIYFLTKKMKYSQEIAQKAVRKLNKTLTGSEDLYKKNENIYSLLKYGIKVTENTNNTPKTVYLIDFENPMNNDYYIAEEVTIVETSEKRPDLVIYLNGIAVAVIELKKGSISVAEGIRQNITNQEKMFIPEFFATIQFCIAGNESEGLKYGTIQTPEKEYLVWQNDKFIGNEDEINEVDLKINNDISSGEIESKLLKDIYSIFYKKRFLNLIENFVIFDRGSKKICRYNQYFAVMRAQKRLAKKENGIIWHTQGSGKSLTMVWLSKWIISNLGKSRVLIITDREELDEQIEKLYNGVKEKIVRTKSGEHLFNILNSYEDRIICSLIHKFRRHDKEETEDDVEEYIKELKKSLPENFEPKDDIYVFVDECHRTQSGKLHKAMKTILPKAIFIGFTGTPILKQDKKNTMEIFGNFIHSYIYKEAVRDGVVLDLKYEARDIPQDLSRKEKIDQWFESKTSGLIDIGKAKLKKKWANMQAIYSSKSRLEKIVMDIIFDFETKNRLKSGKGNAILVADSIYSACKYYEIFTNNNFTKCAIISSYLPNKNKLRTEFVDDESDTEEIKKYKTYMKMIGINPDSNFKDDQITTKIEAFEKEAKQKFIKEPSNMKLLIVVDKLLTGFDAPPCTYLYIDKTMHDHSLFQAVCRVNRLDGQSKDFGYIVDYKQLFGSLNKAMQTYNSENPFAGYDKEDVVDLLKNNKEESEKYFYETLDSIESLCEGVKEPKNPINYQHYFCGQNVNEVIEDKEKALIRKKLYSLTDKLIRAYSNFKPFQNDLKYSEEQKNIIHKKVLFYTELKSIILRASGDFTDLKVYEPDMRLLIDHYIVAWDSTLSFALEDFTLLDFIKSTKSSFLENKKRTNFESEQQAAETIENNIAKKIVEKNPNNPKYYQKMSSILEELIEDRKKGVILYKELLEKYEKLANSIETPKDNLEYPESIKNSPAKIAFYNNFGEDEKLANDLHHAVLQNKMDSFRGNKPKEQIIKQALFEILKDKEKVDEAFEIVLKQNEY